MDIQSLVVRDAEPGDAGALMTLIRSAAEFGGHADAVRTNTTELERAMSGPAPKFAAYVAEADGRLVGFASYTPCYSIWLGECFISVDDLFVMESARSSGIGRQLMVAVAQMCHEQNCRARWEIAPDDDNHAFLEAMGVALRPGSFCEWSKSAIAEFLVTQDAV